MLTWFVRPPADDTATGSRVSAPKDIEALSAGSAVVVIARPQGEPRVETVFNSPFMVQEFAVTERWKGDPPATLAVRMEGSPADNKDVSPQREYVLYLNPFEFERGVSTGQWWISGAGVDGIFVVDGDSALRIRHDPASPIKERQSIPSLRAAVGG
ncbi:hypothetical protein N802_15395 [Knoellia sinensis KCTC 19936]|uniref:Uncharacterized protein n=2 Tax=Knoellia TaxID=136099 RepID=A0A0A0J6P9_9MICO|nr:hypothetical protein N802_15395 [Knoellia sinensis KCTC 19936]